MAHFIYPAGTPLGVVPFGYVFPSSEWQSTIRQVYKAINGDEGGTWAPSSYIVVGGSGFSLTGTGHQLAASARLTVQSTAEIRVANGGLVKLDGTGGDILMKVAGGIATIEAETGTVIKVNAGGALDMYGSFTLKDTNGPGSFTAEANTTITLLSGSTMTAAASSTINLTGAVALRGILTVKSSGGPGQLILESSTTNLNAGTISHLSTSTNSYTSGAEESGTVLDSRATTRTGKTTRTGSGARVARRTGRLLADASEDVTVADDTVRVRQTVTGIHVYTLRHTGTVPTAGEQIHSYRSGTTTPSAHGATFAREDGTILFSYAASKQGYATFEFDGTDWQLVGPWGLFASGDNSGSYGNVW